MSGGGKFCSKVHKVHAVWESFIIVSVGENCAASPQSACSFGKFH
jgi:hypothetical protein